MKNRELLEIARKQINKKYLRPIYFLLITSMVFLTIISMFSLSVKEGFKDETYNDDYILSFGYLDKSINIDDINKDIFTLRHNQFEFAAKQADSVERWEEFLFDEQLEEDNYLYKINNETFENRIQSLSVKVLDDVCGEMFADKNNYVLFESGFTSNKAEIMVSERFLNKQGLDKNVLGKNLSLSVNLEDFKSNTVFIDNDNDENNLPDLNADHAFNMLEVFKNYKIVGIIKDAYYTQKDCSKCDIWIKKDSIKDNVVKAIKPLNNKLVVTYIDLDIELLNKETIDDGCFFVLFGAMKYNTYYEKANNYYLPETRCCLTFKNFDTAAETIALVDQYYYENGLLEKNYDFYSNDLLTEIRYNNLKNWLNIIFTISFIISCITLLVITENAFSYIIIKKKEYLSFLNKIGMKKKDRIKALVLQFVFIWSLSAIIALVLNSMLVLVINLGLDKILTLSLSVKFKVFMLSNIISISTCGVVQLIICLLNFWSKSDVM